jgi:acyl-CoA thioesterase FadM
MPELPMNLLFRMIAVIVSAWLKRGTTRMKETHTVVFRVLPNDLDTNMHMNNGRYLTLMDLGRVDMMLRAGLMAAILREKWMPVIAGVSMVYRRSLGPFERFTLHTRLIGWDERWVYMEQTFLNAKGELSARGFVKAAFLKGGERVPSASIAAAAGGMVSPPLDAALLALFPRT